MKPLSFFDDMKTNLNYGVREYDFKLDKHPFKIVYMNMTRVDLQAGSKLCYVLPDGCWEQPDKNPVQLVDLSKESNLKAIAIGYLITELQKGMVYIYNVKEVILSNWKGRRNCEGEVIAYFNAMNLENTLPTLATFFKDVIKDILSYLEDFVYPTYNRYQNLHTDTVDCHWNSSLTIDPYRNTKGEEEGYIIHVEDRSLNKVKGVDLAICPSNDEKGGYVVEGGGDNLRFLDLSKGLKNYLDFATKNQLSYIEGDNMKGYIKHYLAFQKAGETFDRLRYLLKIDEWMTERERLNLYMVILKETVKPVDGKSLLSP